jgi:hypothetical protein
MGGLSIAETLTGDRARSMVDQMHGKGVTPAESMVARYEGKDGETATVYCSRYASTRDAAEAEGRMRELIGRGNAVFTGYGEYVVGGKRVSMCRGLGQTHYFFTSGRRLTWLAGEEENALQMLQDLLSYADAHSRE